MDNLKIRVKLFEKDGHKVIRIKTFTDKYGFLCTTYPCGVIYDGMEYHSVFHAFQASKTMDCTLRAEIAAETWEEAKARAAFLPIREDWDLIRDHLMLELQIFKFFEHRKLRALLMRTGEAELIEGNSWGGDYWGTVNGKGQNKLGQVLMQVRDGYR